MFSLPTAHPDAFFYGIELGPDGNGWAVTGNPSGFARITPEGVVTYFPSAESSAAEGNRPSSSNLPGIVNAPDGAMWFASSQWRLGRLQTDGSVETYSVGGFQPRDVAVGPDGALWFTAGPKFPLGSTVNRFDLTSREVTQTIELPGFNIPFGIVTGGDGNLWVTSPDGNQLARVSLSGQVTVFTGAPGEVSYPSKLTLGADGNVWFTSPGNGRIGRITPAGAVTTFGGFTTGAVDITTGPDGNVWVVERYDGPGPNAGRIARITPGGVVSEFELPDEQMLPYGITPGPDGDLWFTAESAPWLPSDLVGRVTVLNPVCNDAPPPHGFADVSPGAWYSPGLDWAACHGIAEATGPEQYRPGNALKRKQLAEMLWDMVDRPGGSPGSGATDVAADAPYRRAVDWIVEEGIMSMWGDDFRPSEPVNRRQWVKALWALAGSPQGSPPHGFSDVPAGASYAPALDWADDHGIDGSFSETRFKPGRAVPRGPAVGWLDALAADASAWASWTGPDVSTWRFDP